MHLLTNGNVATMETGPGDGEQPYGLVRNGAILLDAGRIRWVGNADNLPEFASGAEVVDLSGRLVTPSLIDCHTHVVFGGNRANEFEMRLNGKSYEEVARAGGGIVSTVSATRASTLEQLIESSLPRVDALIAEGVTTLEVKSGYGLDVETELNMLRAAQAIEERRSIRIKKTFLGAHAIPAEYKGKPESYLDEVCIPALKAAHAEGLVDAVDGFCEGIAFTTDQIDRVFQVARQLGLAIKLHAEQLSNIGGTQLATRFGAISVDHLEYANEDDVKSMAVSGSVAVLLPGAFYTIRETQLPPVKAFREQQVDMAVATDCNPGSSPMTSLLLAMNMACTLFRMTPEEALAGVTRNAAKALGLSDSGRIREGLRADLAIWNVQHPCELSYRIGFNPLHQRVFEGVFSGASH